VLPPLLALCAASIFVITTRDRLGLATSIVLTLGFGAGAIARARDRSAASTWLVVAFGLRALHAAMEAAAYGVNLATDGQPDASVFAVPANALLAAHYSLGIGAEWLLAMGCVIGVAHRGGPRPRVERRSAYPLLVRHRPPGARREPGRSRTRGRRGDVSGQVGAHGCGEVTRQAESGRVRKTARFDTSVNGFAPDANKS
jgi:hypothetical protein